MKKQFVTYEIALKLKELGFDEECFGYYSKQHDDSYFLCIYQQEDEYSKERLEAPLWQQVIDWFREKHDIIINIFYEKDVLGWKGYNRCYFIITFNTLVTFDSRGEFRNIFYNNSDYTKETAILKAIEVCQNKS